MKRQREESMRELYESWQESGLSKKAFAIEEKIDPITFYYWAKKFKSKTKDPSTKGFQRVVLKDTVPLPPATAIIRYPSGVSIEWHGDTKTIHFLKALL